MTINDSGWLMRYGPTEFVYAEPIADALASNAAFRTWVLRQTRFASFADHARLMQDEMQKRRSKLAETWWRSHFTEKCRCEGDRGQETDMLAIFEVTSGFRFALHFEVKHAGDRFPKHKDQAAAYAARAKCWVATPPRAVVPHSDAATSLICSRTRVEAYRQHLTKFDSVFTFEDIGKNFPDVLCPS